MTLIPWTPERTPRCDNPGCHPHTMEWHDDFLLWLCESCGCSDRTIGPPPSKARETPRGYLGDDVAAQAAFGTVPGTAARGGAGR